MEVKRGGCWHQPTSFYFHPGRQRRGGVCCNQSAHPLPAGKSSNLEHNCHQGWNTAPSQVDQTRLNNHNRNSENLRLTVNFHYKSIRFSIGIKILSFQTEHKNSKLDEKKLHNGGETQQHPIHRHEMSTYNVTTTHSSS